MKKPCTYILASKEYGTLYTGVTADLIKRVWQHKEKANQGFTTQHNIDLLVFYEMHQSMYAAITREKQIKKWKRAWKIRLIEERNLYWEDLYTSIL